MNFTPLYFDENELTGSGGRTGLLNETQTTYCYAGRSPVSGDDYRRKTEQNGQSTVDFYPLSLLPEKIWPEILACSADQKDPLWMCIGSNSDSRFLIRIEIQSLTLEKVKNPYTGKQEKTLYPRWRVLWAFPDLNPNQIHVSFTCDLPRLVNRLLKDFDLIPNEMQLESLWHQTMHDYICLASRHWQTDLIQAVSFGIQISGQNALAAADILAENLTNYRISMEDCFALIRYLRQVFVPEDVRKISQHNLHLLLCCLLEDLHGTKDDLIVPPESMSGLSVDPFFSPAQKAILESFSPLMLVQSVAGSGKSTVVNGRIHHLIASGVKPDDIMVLSFTNAAADHIKELNPSLKSMTIDAMASELYKANFPDQKDVPAETLANALETIADEDPVSLRLSELLRQITCNQNGAELRLYQLLYQNLPKVMECLQNLQMICLQLKPMLCYLLLSQLYIPESVQAFFLIVDEVQDNSIFQHILILHYVTLFKVNLMMVGDGSQTLYEWRNSDPKALNAMEASGIFDAYQLTCNFRSNQLILDFANEILSDIEANQYARLQLYAFDQKQPESNAVIPCVIPLQSSDAYWETALSEAIENFIYPWVMQQVKEGRQTCLLVSSHREIDFIKSQMDYRLPSPILDISSVHSPASTIFSKFVKNHLSDIFNLSGDNFCASLVECIASRVISHKAASYQRRDLNQWSTRSQQYINQIAAAYYAGNLEKEEFSALIRKNLLDFEADLNIRKTEYRSRQNAEMKSKENLEKEPVLISTVHSAKGLEFDSTVVLIKEKGNLNEADKRTAYVALTRAKKREMVLLFTQKPDAGFSKMFQISKDVAAAPAGAGVQQL